MRFIVLSIALLAAITATAQAQLSLTFDSDIQGMGQNTVWSSGVSGWSGGGVAQHNGAAGGWTMGSGGGPMKEYDWTHGQPEIQAIVATGQGKIDFDIIVDGTSFPNNAGTWYQFWMAGNSGTGGWTQSGPLTNPPNGEWRNQDDNSLRTWHIQKTFAEVGWVNAGDWYQLFWGSNSDADKPIRFYLDNIVITPEPASLGLLALGSLVLMRSRRRA